MFIPQSFIDDLLARTNIIDVLSQSLTLKKRGSNYICCCPFHNEKTPSFSVSQTKQIYKCFGCGQSGNVLSFLMDYSHLTYIEAIEFLAKFHGMEVPREQNNRNSKNNEYAAKNKAKNETYEKLTTVMQKAADYYYSQLKQSAEAINYCKERGISGQIAKFFHLGFAPDGWNNLKALCDNDMEKYNKNDDLLLAGLTIQHEEKKQRYDRFRSRLMIPIFDTKGKIIAFGGRILSKANQHNSEMQQHQAKYLNSPETPIFVKGQGLFGLYQAKNFIRQNNEEIIVCEGYLDVIMLKQFGIDNAIATLGTATTSQQIRLLLRYAKSVIFCFDGDEAGRRAAVRAMTNALSEIADDKILQFAFLPQDEDPDSFVQKFGAEKFREFLHNPQKTLTLSKFFMQHLQNQNQNQNFDASTAEGRSQILNEAKNLLPLMQKSPLLKIQLIKQVAEITQFSEEEIRKFCESNKSQKSKYQQYQQYQPNQQIQQNISQNIQQNISPPKTFIPKKFEKNISIEFLILKILLHYPNLLFDENLEVASFPPNSEAQLLLSNLQNIALTNFDVESAKNSQKFYEVVNNFFDNSCDTNTKKLKTYFEKIKFNSQDLPLKDFQAYCFYFHQLLNNLKNGEQRIWQKQRINELQQKLKQNLISENEKLEFLDLLRMQSQQK